MMTSQASSPLDGLIADQERRHIFIRNLIGCPYEKNARGPKKFDCWHLAVYVQYHMFGRQAPNIDVPEDLTWRWMIEQFTTHPELQNWVEILQPKSGLVTASDGAMVLMAKTKYPAHCGVFFLHERAILHADEAVGVSFEDLTSLRMNGWSRLSFYEPK